MFSVFKNYAGLLLLFSSLLPQAKENVSTLSLSEIVKIYELLEKKLTKNCYRSDLDRGAPQSLIEAIHKNLPETLSLKPLHSAKQLPAYEHAVIVSMVKNEGDVIFENLCWHYFMGFRKFIIVDNGSTDNTGKLINSFKKKTSPSTTVIRIDDPRKGHRQTSTTNGCAKLAQIIFPKALWIFPNDADEFIVLDEPLENALSKVPNTVNCIYTPRITYIPSDDFFTYQKATPFYESIHIAHKRNPYSNPDDSKYNGKTFIRAQQGLLVTKGNHVATLTTPTQPLYISAHDIGIHIREFPLRSPEHALKKIIKMGIANNDFDKAYPNAQFRHYAHEKYENYLKQGDAAGMEEFKKFMAQGGCIFDERMPLKLALRTVLQPQ